MAAVTALAIGGGMCYYTTPACGLAITAVLIVGWFLLPLRSPFIWLIVVAALSAMANIDIFDVTSGRVLLYAGALGLYAAQINPQPGLYLAAMAWPVVWAVATLAGWSDNANIQAFWPLLFIWVLFYHRPPQNASIWPIVLSLSANLAILLYLGSRGALLGLLAGLLFAVGGLWPVVGLIPLAALALAYLRPETALLRLHYWQSALTAWWPEYIWFGLGPGGLWARQAIAEPGGGWQIHAHNHAITWLTETGLVGLLALLPFILHALRSTLHAPRSTLLCAIAAWSLVDCPLWWPGPLLALALALKTPTKIVTPTKN